MLQYLSRCSLLGRADYFFSINEHFIPAWLLETDGGIFFGGREIIDASPDPEQFKPFQYALADLPVGFCYGGGHFLFIYDKGVGQLLVMQHRIATCHPPDNADPFLPAVLCI